MSPRDNLCLHVLNADSGVDAGQFDERRAGRERDLHTTRTEGERAERIGSIPLTVELHATPEHRRRPRAEDH